ncbi:MAG: DegT/DnrJ/EryC1/StrS family aminotransferase [Rhodoferax sp.]
MRNIPLLKPTLPHAGELLPYLQRIDSTHWYTNFGPLQAEFLHELITLQAQLDSQDVHGLLAANATLGLELALASLNLAPGSHVGVPALTFAATATAVQRAGHTPLALDVDPDTWLLTPDCVSAHAVSQIDAIVPVSTFGMPQDASRWSSWSRIHGKPVVIDAAAAFGAQKTAPDITVVFSLHATKTLSSVEGGLVVTQNAPLADRMRAMTNFGFGLEAPSVATNAKMSEYHAAVGLAHLTLWPSQVRARQVLLQEYKEALAPLTPGRLCFQQDTGLYAPSLMPIRLKEPELRDRLEALCAARGIQTRRWYQPLVHQLPSMGSVKVLEPPIESENLAHTLLGLPFYPGLSPEELATIAEAIHSL